MPQTSNPSPKPTTKFWSDRQGGCDRTAFPSQAPVLAQKCRYFQFSPHPESVKSPHRKSGRALRPPPVRRSFGLWKTGLALLVAGLAAGWFAWQQRKAPARYTARPRGTVTFNKDIAPIVFGHCAG